MKKAAITLSIILVLVLLAGGLSYLSFGFSNWDYKSWFGLGSVVEAPEEVEDDNLLDSPISSFVASEMYPHQYYAFVDEIDFEEMTSFEVIYSYQGVEKTALFYWVENSLACPDGDFGAVVNSTLGFNFFDSTASDDSVIQGHGIVLHVFSFSLEDPNLDERLEIIKIKKIS